MLIGIPQEIKNHEYRVGMVPASVQELTSRGHKVVVETSAGNGIGFSDEDYREAGASIVDTAAEVFAQAEMIVKVKEPQAIERKMLRPGQLLFTYLHLAPDPEQTNDLVASGSTCIAYETVTSDRGGLPLLAPMSEVAGRMSIQAGAACLEKSKEGRGMLLGGVPGVEPAKVVIIGGGVVGSNAARMAIGMGAQVVILDLFMPKMDGFEIIDAMQASPDLREIPVIVVSGGDITSTQQEKLDSLNHHLLQKGVLDSDELLATLERSLNILKKKGNK